MATASTFQIPKSLELDEATATQNYGKFTLAPLERGFGHTLGSAIRRVLLSSLEGAAISAVRIDGASHEFATLADVVEDVTEIILNLKQVRLNSESDTIKILELKATKAGVVTAADIITDGTTEVLNPECVICHLDKNIPFRIEMEVSKGRGYRQSEQNKQPDHPVGTILIDSLFSPVTRVRYNVGSARLGEETELDSLILEVWTDGRLDPETAVTSAATILKDHLRPLLGSQIGEEDLFSAMNEDDQRLFRQLSQDVEVLDLSVRAMNCLNNANIRIIGELCMKTESRMLKYRNFGKKSLDEIKQKLEGMKFCLGMSLSEELTIALQAEADRIKAEEEEN